MKRTETKTSVAEIRAAMEYYERVILLKTNGGANLSSVVYEPMGRKPKESFVNYVIRIHRDGFRSRDPRYLPRKRLNRNMRLRVKDS